MRNSLHKCTASLAGRPSLWGHHRPEITGFPYTGRPGYSSVITRTSGIAHLIHTVVETLARFLYKEWASLCTAFFLGGEGIACFGSF